MRKILTAVMLSLALFGCKSYVQVINTNSSIKTNDEGFYVYENDTLKITYRFWKDKGIMSFTIHNKADKPIYVDWKKSSYIDNSVKLNYWVDEQQTNSSDYYGSYYYSGPLLLPGFAISSSGGNSVSKTIKVERITFIPPKSNYNRSQFYILPILRYNMGSKAKTIEVPRNDNPKKKTEVYSLTFTKDNTPLIFRNFLTVSFSEDFETEFYVDSEFYIEEILEMDERHFNEHRLLDPNKRGRWFIRDENGNPIKVSDFEKPSSFYLNSSMTQ